MKLFKLERDWGPLRLRKIHKAIVAAINERAPKEGIGIEVKENPDGCQISLATNTKKTRDTGANKIGGGGSGTGGTASDLEGALNGQPVTFHLLQSAEPTPRT